MDIFLYAVLLGAAIFVLVKSSYYVVRSLSAIARYVGVSEFILSFLLLSIATSLSELTVGINAAVGGIPELSLGDVLGTNLVNITLVLGIITVIGRGVLLRDHVQFKKTRITTLILVTMPFILLLDGQLSRLDGAILLLAFLIHIIRILRDKDTAPGKQTFRHSMEPHVEHTANSRKNALFKTGIFALSSAILIGAAYLIVYSVTQISDSIGVPEFVIGLFVIAVGTSLPELSVGLRAVFDGKAAVSVGNLFGAIGINSTLVLGTVALISPIYVDSIQQYAAVFILTLLAMFTVYLFLRKKAGLTTSEGIVLLLIYALFLVI